MSNIVLLLGAFMVVFALSRYIWFRMDRSRKTIDENYAARLVQKALGLSGQGTASVLKGGFSNALLFAVTSGSQKYVVRFFKHKSPAARQEEIAQSTTASEAGYGPHLYYADADEAVVIMEYLAQQEITDEQRESSDLYVALAHLLQKIHRGPTSEKGKDLFKKIHEGMSRIKKVVTDERITTFPIEQLETIIATLQKASASMTLIAPCHGDLNPANTIFLGHEFKAIDFEGAAQANPYFDIATIANYYCFEPASEHLMFSTYLEHEPSAQEQAQLYVMKQVALLRSGVGFIKRVPEKISTYATIQVSSHRELFKGFCTGKMSLEKPESKMLAGKILIDTVIANFESQEFKNAVKALARHVDQEQSLL